MDNLFGFLVAVFVVGFSIWQRVQRSRNQQGAGRPQTPTWPGPVAQPPRIPGMPSRPTWPEAPRPAAQQPPAPPQRTATLIDEEGPEAEEQVDRELERFGRETQQMENRQIDEAARFEKQSQEFERRQFADLRGGLARTNEAAPAVSNEPAGSFLELSDPEATARALVLAEVLGKPKALRKGRL